MPLRRLVITAVLLSVAFPSAATDALAGEVLYNGIELPDQWPPGRSLDELRSGKPMRVPYLERPPALIPIDVGRQLFADDFLAVAERPLAVHADDARPPVDEQALKNRYDGFVKSLDHRRLAEDYAGAVRNLDSADPKRQIVGIRTLAATDELSAIPWIVPFLDSEDRRVRIYAGQALNTVVASHQLKRRDKSRPEKVVILPPGLGDVDLSPMSWVILKMLRKPDDGNTQAFAANMIGYLGLEEYEPQLRRLLKSRHPSVRDAAHRALQMIGAPEAGEDDVRADNLTEPLE